jgi:hypothetical protein
MTKPAKPFHKITMIQSRLQMYVEYGDAALQGQTPREFATEVAEAFGYLMDFRNIINGMVGFDDTPKRAALPYLEDVREKA